MKSCKLEYLGYSKVILAIAAIILVGAGIFGISRASAQTPTSTPTGLTSIIQKLAQKFGLKEADVQAVFDSAKADRMTARLDQLVKDGKLTEAQKQAIIAKHKDSQNWAKQNGIDLKTVFGMGGMGRMGWGRRSHWR